jgi:hypothetical protein
MGLRAMRVMVFVKGDPQTEQGVLPPEGLVEKMTAYNERLVQAGVLLAADGLYPSAKGVRVRFDGSKRSVIDGPFAEAKELVAGYWLWQVRSLDEAVEWLKQAPFEGGDVEIRPIFESDDFLAEYGNPELAERESRLKAAVAERG